MISVKNLRKTYRDRPALDGVTLDFPPGETTVVVGASGAGKSTLLRCLNLLEWPEEGTISAGGVTVDVSRETPRTQVAAVRSASTMVFQHFHLYPHLSLLDNVTLAPTLTTGVGKAQAREDARRLLARVGLEGRDDDYPSQLSGGQQQRVAIARALALSPDYLLCDEPTSALDPQIGKEISGLLSELAGEGLTLIVVTHDMAFARRSATRVVFLREGRVAYDGTPAAFFDSEDPAIRAFLAAE